ncbi:MAG: hypothetical protein NC218_07260 [Acetobacter sp.]|nr:hypothetical protein [Acetobacter sp.]
MAKVNKEQQVVLFMEKLKISREDAEKLFEYDRAIDSGEKTPYDLSAEQQKVVSKMTRADRKPTVYNLTKRERKPNATKGLIIAALATFLAETGEFAAENIEITNKERQIKFQSAGETFELTLVQKRKPKS